MEKSPLKTRILSLLVCLLVLTTFSTTILADSYLYDKNGNMIQEQAAAGNKCYIYNSANQLVKVTDCAASPKTIAEYSYDQTGRRIRTIEYLSSGTVTTYYPFDDYETVVGGTTPGNTLYYFANGERVARKDPDNTVHYYHGDHLGSTSMITSSTGAVEENTKYDPFGAVRSGGTKSKYLYTGKEQDTETGLYYYGARYYDPDPMHFTQPDMIIPNVYDPQSLNKYSYVKNNPMKYTDPSGHQAEVIIGGTTAFGAEVALPVVIAVGAFVVLGYCIVELPTAVSETYKSIKQNNDLLEHQAQNANQEKESFSNENEYPDIDVSTGDSSNDCSDSSKPNQKGQSSQRNPAVDKSRDKLFNDQQSKSTNFKEEQLPNGNWKFSKDVPSNTPGWKKVYIKIVDSCGKTVDFTKELHDPNGKLVNIKTSNGDIIYDAGK